MISKSYKIKSLRKYKTKMQFRAILAYKKEKLLVKLNYFSAKKKYLRHKIIRSYLRANILCLYFMRIA